VFYGPALDIRLSIVPFFSSPDPNLVSARTWLANAHFWLAFFFLQGHIWHALRAAGFDFQQGRVAKETASPIT
jgi:photosystem II CP43 chlorophyll apoprotein